MTFLDAKAQLEAARAELKRSYDLSDYEAVDVAWVAVVMLANLLPGDSERKRLLALLERLDENQIRAILEDKAVDSLLNLDPPLESVLAMSHERLDQERTARELSVVRERRVAEPRVALDNLANVLKRIRNRRAHGFKTRDGQRDQQILGAAVAILHSIGKVSLDAVDT